jgi:mannose-1-phosphate guanylyltransferase/mannose-1-phosphate guanylyltransferase/mannose-6-phosphate isomerase
VTEPAIQPVILAGGNGTRLWPLSRPSHPKQFARILGEESLFQAAARRLAAPGFAAPIIVTQSAFRFLATGQLAEARLDPGPVLLEPEGRDTAPAVLAAALSAAEMAPDALLLVCPSDHAIADSKAFHAAVAAGVPAAQAGRLVTFGVVPDRPETAYGYLELAAPADPSAPPAPLPLRRFVEKPDAATAARLAASGRHLWNSGIFLFRADAIRAAFAEHAPEILAAVTEALAAATPDLGFLRLAPDAWARAPSRSLDYAVMEHATGLAVVPLACPWSDLGSWDAVARAMAPGTVGNAAVGPVEEIDCRNSLLRAEDEDQVLVGIGLRDLVVVAMRDAVLVADRGAGEAMRDAVARLEARGLPQARSSPRCHRPWGWYETLALGPRFQVKRIMVEPGGQLSLQSHVHRAEHWVVVAGTARVTLDGATRILPENESIYVGPGAVHRLENPGKLALHLVEVQTGPYLGEDDITRYADAYLRN